MVIRQILGQAKAKINSMKKKIVWGSKLDKLTNEELIEYIYIITKDISYKHWKKFASADNTDVKSILNCALDYSSDPIFLEIGSFMGRTTCALGMAATIKRNQGMVVAIDNFGGDPKHQKQFNWVNKTFSDGFFDIFWKNITKFSLENHVHPIKKFSNEAIDDLRLLLNGRKCDIIFIDGDHTYDGVCSDINNYLPFLADGGTMILDDYSNKAVRSAAENLLSKIKCHHYTANDGKIAFFKLP